MKFAYFVVPQIGGTYTVFKHLRHGLAEFGIDVTWLGVARNYQPIRSELRQEMRYGTLLHIPEQLDERAAAACLVGAIETRDYDGIFINVLSDRLQTNIARYLPENLTRVMIVHNITPGTYAAARAVRDHVHATIGVAVRCRDDLVARYGFPASRTFSILNAVEGPAPRQLEQTRTPAKRLRVICFGRMEDASKGIFLLPAIVDKLPRTIDLTIAGDGPDLPQLRQRLAHRGKTVTFTGAIDPSTAGDLLARHDVLIMPSRFEGCPLALLEAMAVGCVPVASRLRGVTDTIVKDGVEGHLFAVGDHDAAARMIRKLDADRDLLARMSLAARRTIAERFTVREMAERYHDVIRGISEKRPQLAPSLPISDWSMPRGLRPGLRSYLPDPMKNWLRTLRERF